MHVAMLLEMAAESGGDRIVVGSRKGGLTAADLLLRARHAAASFTARGVANVGFIDVNSEALPVTMFGAAVAGLPFAPVNYRLTDDKLQAIVARLAPGVIIAGEQFVSRVSGIDGVEVITVADLMALTADESTAALPEPT